MLEVLAGALVAFAAIALVLEPLVRRDEPGAPFAVDDESLPIALEESDSPKVRALLALREIEFDRATGKLSDEDYATLRAKYSAVAVAAIHSESDQAPGPDPGESIEDAVEAAIQRARHAGRSACPACGPRPEPGAVFCSSCGRALANPDARPRCWQCGATLPGQARFCPGCGGALAA